eukprot:gene7175-5166_t
MAPTWSMAGEKESLEEKELKDIAMATMMDCLLSDSWFVRFGWKAEPLVEQRWVEV